MSAGDSPALAAALKRFEDLHPETIELSLHRILDALEALGRPQDRLPPVIHVAGTNGKGSVCAFLRAMAEAAGYNVHVFTSPHLVRFNERIRLNGRLVEDDPLIDWLDRLRVALDDRPITHFEATTAAALLGFSETPADLLILEVGLGGRYDATNVVDVPALSVITPVDYDHKQFLGGDLGKIAWEKAGVIKPGVPVVSARQADVAAQVIAEEAFARNAPLHHVTQDDAARLPQTLSLRGAHQTANAALALKALSVWTGAPLPDATIRTGLQNAVWPARMQPLAPGPIQALGQGAEVWLDGGHNPHAARAIAALLREMPGETVLVTAMMESKDHRGYFAAFDGAARHVYTCPNAQGHANAAPLDLAEAARAAGLQATPCDSLDAAMAAAAASGAARILISGSLYLAGEVLHANGEAPL